jgi:CheY-like chemotaxis protein
MVMKPTWNVDQVERTTPNVVVVDPQFDAYRELAASARSGRIGLHFRSSGSQAMKLARHLEIDAWLVASELDDMSGHDLVELLQAQFAAERRIIGSLIGKPNQVEAIVANFERRPPVFADR